MDTLTFRWRLLELRKDLKISTSEVRRLSKISAPVLWRIEKYPEQSASIKALVFLVHSLAPLWRQKFPDRRFGIASLLESEAGVSALPDEQIRRHPASVPIFGGIAAWNLYALRQYASWGKERGEGIRQEDLARSVGIDPRSLSRIETGRSTGELLILLASAKFFTESLGRPVPLDEVLFIDF